MQGCSGKHPADIINANPAHQIDLDIDFEKEVGQSVLWSLCNLTDGIYYKCQNCGGLLPEIAFSTKDRMFIFTCTQITDHERTIAETDYKRLERHLHKRNIARDKAKAAKKSRVRLLKD